MSEQEEVFRGFTLKELHDAFDKVKDPKDWKNPIRHTIDLSEINVTAAAIEFFTATDSTCQSSKDRKVVIEAPGYYIGPAGP